MNDESMWRKRTLAELTAPDERTLRFTPLGLSLSGTLTAEAAAEFQQQLISKCGLHPAVSEGTRNGFERLRSLHSLGVVCYDLFTVVADHARLLWEQALRERFLEFYDNIVPVHDAKTGNGFPIEASTFYVVDQAFQSGGSHRKGSWELTLTDGSTMRFRGRMSELQSWARRERLLDGQRNKRLDAVHQAMRNAVAHPSYHLTGPPDSARTICDLAEMINRLWGYRTSGGRLYPAPIERQVLLIAWNESSGTRTVLRDYQLETYIDGACGRESEPWKCLVLRGVFEDESIMDFDARYERTVLPVDFLWGPGSVEDASSWISVAKPKGDQVDYLDRTFALRIHEGRVSLARRPEVALALSSDRRGGRWLLLRADYPNDAFAHARHLKDGVTCGPSDPVVGGNPTGRNSAPGCAIEGLYDGDWEGMTAVLDTELQITDLAPVVGARVPPRFSVASRDVEAD